MLLLRCNDSCAEILLDVFSFFRRHSCWVFAVENCCCADIRTYIVEHTYPTIVRPKLLRCSGAVVVACVPSNFPTLHSIIKPRDKRQETAGERRRVAHNSRYIGDSLEKVPTQVTHNTAVLLVPPSQHYYVRITYIVVVVVFTY